MQFLPDGLIMLNHHGEIVLFNLAAEKIFQWSSEELLGKDVRLLLSGSSQSDFDSFMFDMVNSPSTSLHRRELQAKRKDQSTFPIHLNLNEIRINDVVYFIGMIRDITLDKFAVTALENEVKRFMAVMDVVLDAVVIINKMGAIIDVNNTTLSLFNYEKPQLIGRNVRILMNDKDNQEHDKYLQNYLSSGMRKIIGIGREVLAKTSDGVEFPIELTINEMMIDAQLMFIGSIKNLSQQKRAERALRDKNKEQEALLNSMTDGVISINEHGIIQSINRAASVLLGYMEYELVGQNVSILMPEPYHSEHDNYIKNFLYSQSPKVIGIGREVITKTKDGREIPVALSVAEYRLDDRYMFVGTLRDISEKRQNQEKSILINKLIELNRLDPLTGLLNHEYFESIVIKQLSQFEALNEPYVLCFININQFPEINENFGHNIGDKVLSHLGKALKTAVTSNDVLARLGGSEFVLFSPLMNIPADGIELYLEQLLRKVCVPFEIEERWFKPFLSIGVYVAPPYLASLQEIERNAELALSHAKQQNSSIVVYNEAIGIEYLNRNYIINILKKSFEENFTLYYHPIYDVSNNQEEIRYFELLLRPKQPFQRDINIYDVIITAEQYGYMMLLGTKIVEFAFKEIASMSLKPGKFRFNINISAVQFEDPGFTDFVKMLMSQYSVLPELLTFELTESAFMHKTEILLAHVEQLRALGFYIALDDFGEGYSSLSRLDQMNLDILKLDMAFIPRMIRSQQSQMVVKGLIELAQALSFEVISEGIETQAELDLIKSLGCKLVQGFVFAKPFPKEELLKIIK